MILSLQTTFIKTLIIKKKDSKRLSPYFKMRWLGSMHWVYSACLLYAWLFNTSLENREMRCTQISRILTEEKFPLYPLLATSWGSRFWRFFEWKKYETLGLVSNGIMEDLMFLVGFLHHCPAHGKNNLWIKTCGVKYILI